MITYTQNYHLLPKIKRKSIVFYLKSIAKLYYITLVNAFSPAFEEAQAAAPGNCPRLRPAIEEMLITDPPQPPSRIRMQTYFDTNQVPVKFVFITLFHSSSDKSSGDLTLPKVKRQIKNPELHLSSENLVTTKHLQTSRDQYSKFKIDKDKNQYTYQLYIQIVLQEKKTNLSFQIA